MLLVSIVWILCGLLIYGWTIADFTREYPGLYQRWSDRWELRSFALTLGLFGPVGVLVGLAVCAFRHGWTLRIKQ